MTIEGVLELERARERSEHSHEETHETAGTRKGAPSLADRILCVTLDACLRNTVKLRRAYGGCLGSQRRRRTWTAAISFGEPLTGYDPEISEWGNPQSV